MKAFLTVATEKKADLSSFSCTHTGTLDPCYVDEGNIGSSANEYEKLGVAHSGIELTKTSRPPA